MRYIIQFLILLFPTTSYLQPPHLTGKISISIQNGSFDAELVLSNIPRIEDYYIWLNAGLNIKHFRNINDQVNYGYKREFSSNSYEAFQYYFPASDQSQKFLPESFMIAYSGKFPVFNDTTRLSDWGDWKGNMAFNGNTFRASEQSTFYPVLYDRKNDIIHNSYTYEISLECADCTSLYINGSAPVKASKATLSSDFAVQLLIFAGDFDFKKILDTYLLNIDINHEKQMSLGDITRSITNFYAQKLGISYGSPVVYLSTRPVTKRNSWMFVTYPTIAYVGVPPYRLEDNFDPETHRFLIDQRLKYIAHELGHYYFGTLFRANSSLFWFFLEGITEYIALKASEELAGNEVYHNIISEYVKDCRNAEFIPLHKIVTTNEIGDTYRYKLIPLMLICLEKEAGIESMWQWLNFLLHDQNVTTQYNYFIESLIQSGISTSIVEEFAKKYIMDENFLDNIEKCIRALIN